MRVSISLHTHQHLVSLVFQILTIFIGVQWYLIVVLIFISLKTYNMEHLFIRFFVICVSLVKCLLKSPLDHFRWICLFSYCWTWVLCTILIKSILSFFFMDYAFVFAKSLQNTLSSRFSPMLPSRSFIALCFTVISVISFELIFYRWKVCVWIHVFAYRSPFVPVSFVEKTIFTLLCCLCSFGKAPLIIFL